MRWEMDGETGEWCLESLMDVESDSTANGLWWNHSDDSGWGFNLYSNGAIEFRLASYYDWNGKPTWAFAQGAAGDAEFELDHPDGYCRTCVPRPVTVRPIGKMMGRAPLLSEDVSNVHFSIELQNWTRLGISPVLLSNRYDYR